MSEDTRTLFVVPGDQTTASTRYRILNLLPYLKESGFDCEVLSLENSRTGIVGSTSFGKIVFALNLLLVAPRYDVVYIHRLWFPSVFLKTFTVFANDYIYDFDDALYTSPRWEEVDERRKKRLDRMLSQALFVIAGSPVLVEYASQYTDRVRCLPTSLPREKYESKRKERERKSSDDPIIIGWIGNSPNLRYLATIEDPLQQVLNDFNNVRLHIITAKDREVAPLEDRDDVIYREWSLERELDYLAEADIVIRPLIDDEWTRGKGGFTSVVQAMALEIPVVVTPVAMLRDLVVHGESGFQATTDEEWICYLSMLIENAEMRVDMGTKAAEMIDQNGLWTENHAQELIEIFQEMDLYD